MKIERFPIQILTPAFVGGAACERGPAELRVPTIRGQVRWWFRALGASLDLEADVFGSVHRKPATASSVKFRIDAEKPNHTQARPLPHPGGQKVPPREALAADTRFDLIVADNPLHNHETRCFDLACLAVRAWILLGGMGFRANRGAGSVWPDPPPSTVPELREQVDVLRKQARALGLWSGQSRIEAALVDLLVKSYDHAEKARTDCTDTVLTPNGELGFVDHGRRQASPLKVKVIHLPGEANPWRILRVAFPFDRHAADAGIRVLANAQIPKPLGGPGESII